MKLNRLLPRFARSPRLNENFPLEKLRCEGYRVAPGLRQLIDLGFVKSISIVSQKHEDGRIYYIGQISTPFGIKYLQVVQVYNRRGKLIRKTIGLLDIIRADY